MNDTFRALKITDRVWWVGAIDWDVRDFHGYQTSRGTTYNAFLIRGDRVVLVDTVKKPFVGEMLSRVASVIDPGKIDTVVSNHAEMDHSGALPEVLEAVKPDKLFASAAGAKALDQHFGIGDRVTAVKDAQCMPLGDVRLSFAETRMCHWPDSMVTYLHGDEVLFSQDGFGMHLASTERFADELDPAILQQEAAKYYANILLPLSKSVRKTLDKLGALGLPLKVVAPDHGPIWRREEDIIGILHAYGAWAAQDRASKAVVLYDTMWQSTRSMARAIVEGLAAGGATVRSMSMDVCHRSDVATEILDAGALIVGSPTLNNGIFPTVVDVLCYLKGLKPRGLLGAAFGSYGWSGEAPKQVHALLDEMGVEMVADPIRTQYVPDAEDLAQCRQLGEQVAESLAARRTDT